jgi:hypothetical protein
LERRTGVDRRAGAAPRHGPHLRALATKIRTLVSAVALSAIAAVGSYAGTYRAMEFLFTPAIVAPITAPAGPTDGVAHHGPTTLAAAPTKQLPRS